MFNFSEIQSRVALLPNYISRKAMERLKIRYRLRENRYLLSAYQIYKYIIFFPLLAASTFFLGTIAALLAIFVNKKLASVCGIIWARFNSFITPMIVRVSGREKIEENRSYVIVANHQSQYDIFVIYGWMPVDFRWVMKLELRRVPVLGYACDKIGHIFIDRSSHGAALESINRAKNRIKGGTSIMFFPEGTRSVTGDLKDFKKGAFKFALDMGLPVLPVTILNTGNILPAKSMALFPGTAELIIHDPVDTAGYDENNMHELIAEARSRIQQGLDRNP